MSNFKAHTREEHQLALAQYLPTGKYAKLNPSSNIYDLLYGLGGELTRIDELSEYTFKQLNILTATDLNYISLWEGLVGLPDSVFTQTDSLSLEERRSQVLLKLRGLGTLTKQDFIDLASLLGINIDIEHGIDSLYPPYRVPFYPLSENIARFVMIVKGSNIFNAKYPPYDVPFTPTAENSQITTLFEILKPSMTKILFINN